MGDHMKCLLIFLIPSFLFNLSFADTKNYFPESYEKSKERFLDYAAKIKNTYKGVEQSQIEVGQEKLTIDVLYIPAQVEKRNLIIVTSGNHGAEGYAGSAVQALFIEETLPNMDL